MVGEATNYPHLYLTYAAIFVQVTTQQTFLVKGNGWAAGNTD